MMIKNINFLQPERQEVWIWCLAFRQFHFFPFVDLLLWLGISFSGIFWQMFQNAPEVATLQLVASSCNEYIKWRDDILQSAMPDYPFLKFFLVQPFHGCFLWPWRNSKLVSEDFPTNMSQERYSMLCYACAIELVGEASYHGWEWSELCPINQVVESNKNNGLVFTAHGQRRLPILEDAWGLYAQWHSVDKFH